MFTRIAFGLGLAVAAAVPLSSLAQNWTPVSDRILSDPTYLPLKGQFYGETTYGYEQTNDHTFDPAGANLADVRHTLNRLRQEFAFGVTDALSFRVSEVYGFSGQDRVATAAGVTSTNVSGWADPSFGFTYRLLDQRSNPSSLDLFADYSPDAFTLRTGSATQDQTIARGGASVDFGLALGRETKAFTVRGAVTATYFGGANSTNSDTGARYGEAAYWAPSLRLDTQTRFSDRLSANVGAAYTFNGSPEVVNDLTGTQHTVNLGDAANVNVALNYHFIPNRLVGSVRYDHTFYQNTGVTYPNDPAEDFVRHASSDGVGVSLQYVFK